MDLTPEEEKLVRPYLAMKVAQGKGWIVGVVVGLVVIAASVLLWASGVWPEGGIYLFVAIVVGLVVIEQCVDHRDRVRMAKLLQKYDSVVKQYEQAEDYEQSG